MVKEREKAKKALDKVASPVATKKDTKTAKKDVKAVKKD